MMKPKIRFKGFEDDWEQRKLGELYQKITEKNDLSFETDRIISVANMYFKTDVKESSDEYMRTYNIMRVGDIAFEGNKSKNYAHGRFVENTIGDGIVSHVFDVFRPVEKYDLMFWKYLINNENIMGRILTRCTKASTMMTNLVAKDFLNEKINVPSLKEQHQIGQYFAALDHLITLHQRKCDETKTLKKYMLQKMFPKEGKKVPEIRFAGFTDDWEQRKLGEVVELFGGNAFSSKDSVETGARWLKIANVGIGDLKWNEESFLPDLYLTKFSDYCLNVDDYVMALTRPILNKELKIAKITENNVLLNQRVAKLIFNCDKDFGYQLMRKTSTVELIDNELAGTDPPNLGSATLKNIDVMLPCIKEQEKIAKYLCNIDHLITLHQRKSDELKNLKKYMLQNMFV